MINQILHKRDGFTLIEVAISILILGIIFMALSPFFQQYKANKARDTTDKNLKQAIRALENYKTAFGRLPCPSSLSSNRSSSSYGIEGDCLDTSVSPGSCSADGYCIQESLRSSLLNKRVRIGAIPFREINLSEEDTYDGSNSKLVYVVTEALTSANTFSDTNGGIRLEDKNGTSIGKVPDAIKFLVISNGDNQIGAYNNEGVLKKSCSSGLFGKDVQNCDYLSGINNASFLKEDMLSSYEAGHYDDVIAFFEYGLGNEAGGWRNGIPDQGENTNDLILQGRKVRVGSINTPPTDDLSVAGSIYLPDSATGKTISADFCDFSGAKCFKIPELTRTCPAGNYVTGIADDGAASKVICKPIWFGCDAGKVLSGKEADGTALCVDAPPSLAYVPPGSGGTGGSDGGSGTDGSGGTGGSDGGSGTDGSGGTGGSDGGSGTDGSGGTGGSDGESGTDGSGGTGGSDGGSGTDGSGGTGGSDGGSGTDGSGGTGGSDGGSGTDGSGGTGGSDGGSGTDGSGGTGGTPPTPPVCTPDTKVSTLSCPGLPGTTYQSYETFDCETGNWIQTGSNQISACCSSPLTQAGTESCGPYRLDTTQTRTWIQTLNSATCTYGPKVYSGICMCKLAEIGYANPTFCASSEKFGNCRKVSRSYPLSGTGFCSSYVDGVSVHPGTCVPTNYKWQVGGGKDLASPYSYSNSLIVKANQPCAAGSSSQKCEVNTGSGYDVYNACTCVKETQACIQPW